MLSWERIEQIETTASELANKNLGLGPNAVPIDVYAIARKEGITVLAGTFRDKTIAGMYDRETQRIYLSAGDPYPRQVFTVAHELGHYILHNDLAVEHFYRQQVDEPNSSTKLQEQEANWFAASLLMPKDVLLDMYVKLRGDESTLATLFGVSKQALTYRLANTRISSACI